MVSLARIFLKSKPYLITFNIRIFFIPGTIRIPAPGDRELLGPTQSCRRRTSLLMKGGERLGPKDSAIIFAHALNHVTPWLAPRRGVFIAYSICKELLDIYKNKDEGLRNVPYLPLRHERTTVNPRKKANARTPKIEMEKLLLLSFLYYKSDSF